MIDALQDKTNFAYDAMDRLTTITYPDQTTTSFAYDSRTGLAFVGCSLLVSAILVLAAPKTSKRVRGTHPG